MAICIGDEFTVDESGRLKIVIQGGPADLAWPYPCAVGTFNPLRRQPSGGLWVPPVPVAGQLDAFGTSHSGIQTAVPVAFVTIDTATIDITNPSTCMSARVLRWISVDVDLTLPPGDSQASIRLAGNELLTIENPAPAAGSNLTFHAELVVPQLFSTLTPGQVATFPSVIEAGEGGGGATYGEIRWAIRSFTLALP